MRGENGIWKLEKDGLSANSHDQFLAPGLCAGCRWGRVVRSTRGSSFLLCENHFADARFPKYPRLPVTQCSGFEKSGHDGGHEDKIAE